jgi:hypothetical protein
MARMRQAWSVESTGKAGKGALAPLVTLFANDEPGRRSVESCSG